MIAGWNCTGGSNTTSTVCNGICGDGLRVADETCDDGNKADGIGCLATCLGNITGYYCTGGTPSTPDVCITTCGDGIPVAPGE